MYDTLGLSTVLCSPESWAVEDTDKSGTTTTEEVRKMCIERLQEEPGYLC